MFTLYPYQKEGVAFAMRLFAEGRRGALIADEMGLGKTVQALDVVRRMLVAAGKSGKPSPRVLVVCPASTRGVWDKMRAVHIPQYELPVVSYDSLQSPKLRHLYTGGAWDLVILDEAHFVKNVDAGRTKAVYQLLPKKRILALTGTPVLSYPVELWPMANALRPDIFDSWHFYKTRYCLRTRPGEDRYEDLRGAFNLEELRAKLETFMIRRLKQDVLAELPDKTWVTVPLEIDDTSLELAASEWDAIFARLKDTVGLDEKRVNDALGNLSAESAELAVRKAPACAAYIRDLLDSGVEKVVVFGVHHALLDEIDRQLSYRGVIRIDGRTPAKLRPGYVETFQSDPNFKVFLGSIRAAGHSLTLTAAHHVVMCESDYTPGWMDQASDRCHRIGQKNAVTVHHLVIPGGLDDHVAEIVRQKRRTIDRTVGSSGRNHTQQPKQENGSMGQLESLHEKVDGISETVKTAMTTLNSLADLLQSLGVVPQAAAPAAAAPAKSKGKAAKAAEVAAPADPPAPAAPAAPKIKLEDVRAVCKEKSAAGHKDAVLAAIKEIGGAAKLDDVKPENLHALLEALNAIGQTAEAVEEAF